MGIAMPTWGTMAGRGGLRGLAKAAVARRTAMRAVGLNIFEIWLSERRLSLASGFWGRKDVWNAEDAVRGEEIVGGRTMRFKYLFRALLSG